MAGEPAGLSTAGDKPGADTAKKPLDAKAKRTRNLEYGGAAVAAIVVVLYLRSKSSSSSSTTNAATQSATPATTPEPGLVTPSTTTSGSPPPGGGGGFTAPPAPTPGQPLPASSTPPPASTTAPSGPNAATVVPDQMSGVGTGQPIPTSVQNQIATSNSGYSNEPVGYSGAQTAGQNAAAEAYYADPSSSNLAAYKSSIGL